MNFKCLKMGNKKYYIALGLLFCNFFFSQDLDKIFINKTLKKEVEYFIKFSKVSIDNEIEYLTVNKKEDSIRILQTKKPFIIDVSGRYEPYNKHMHDLIINRNEVNNEGIEDILIEKGKVQFTVKEEDKKLFGDVLKQDIIELEPDVYLILRNLKGYVNYGYVAQVNKNKVWDKQRLMRKEIETKADIRNYLTFFINQKTGDLENMGFLVQDRQTFIETRFGASCLNCQPCQNSTP
ncbi:hypothetical protein IW15_22740 [Chryseobacterium soli]|uniref:Uncharacterized protein n=2 Tax=Chryseobacterium soli TaxID=445961 RepID=A0A085ZUV4_9FLAO|nr:hypothetical protein IW15_22740 [Chryseobacterium soli]